MWPESGDMKWVIMSFCKYSCETKKYVPHNKTDLSDKYSGVSIRFHN